MDIQKGFIFSSIQRGKAYQTVESLLTIKDRSKLATLSSIHGRNLIAEQHGSSMLRQTSVYVYVDHTPSIYQAAAVPITRKLARIDKQESGNCTRNEQHLTSRVRRYGLRRTYVEYRAFDVLNMLSPIRIKYLISM